MKVELKLKRYHPANSMRLGRHIITNQFQLFELNEKEQKSLKDTCGKHWFVERKCEYVKSAQELEENKRKKVLEEKEYKKSKTKSSKN